MFGLSSHDFRSTQFAVFTFGQLLHLRTGKPLRNATRELLQARLEQGVVHKLEDPAHPDTYAVAAKPRAERLSHARAEVRLLSPFDNAVMHRERLAQMFDFEYRLESYVPAAQRKYGYFCLPILWQGAFVGRIDCKADRSTARFHVLNQHLKQGWVPDAAFHQEMQNAIGELARFCGCTEVQ